MLSIIDIIDMGIVSENKFPISPVLVSIFKGNWNALVNTGHTPNFALPFFHLKNEASQVWNLITLPGFENVLTSSNSVKSLGALTEYVRYGMLAEEFYLFLLDKVNRALARAELLKKYFPHYHESSSDNSYDYWSAINSQILNDDPVSYRKRIQDLLDLSKEPDALTHPDGMQIKITRQEIGRIVGCSREMVGRVLKTLEDQGLVSVSGKTMVVYTYR